MLAGVGAGLASVIVTSLYRHSILLAAIAFSVVLAAVVWLDWLLVPLDQIEERKQ